MSLIQKIKADQLAARKQHDSRKSTLLTTLIGEVEIVGKNNGNRETNDLETVTVIKKFIKANNDNIALVKDRPESKMFINAVYDNQILSEYLPKQLSSSAIESFVLEDIKDKQEVSMNMMGLIMKKLNNKYPGQVDGKTASTIVRQILQQQMSK